MLPNKIEICLSFRAWLFVCLVLSSSLAKGQDVATYTNLLKELKSDRYSVSQKAAAMMSNMFDGTSLKVWFQRESPKDLGKAVADSVTDEDLDKLLSSRRTEDVVICTLEVIARLGVDAEKHSSRLIALTRDTSRSRFIRMYSFRSLCSITPPNKSAFSVLDDVGYSLGLDMCESFRQKHSDEPWTSFDKCLLTYSVFELTFDWLADTGHLESEIDTLVSICRKDRRAAVRIWSFMLMGEIGGKEFPILAKEFLTDSNPQVRYFACKVLCELENSELKKISLIKMAKLSEQDRQDLQSDFGNK